MSHNPGFIKLVNDARAKIKECTVGDVKKMLSEGRQFYLVDVREESEWKESRIPGAIYLGKGVIERDIEDEITNHNAEIVLYCGGGYRSALSALALKQMGYTHVASMDGGIRGWRDAGFDEDKSPG